MTTLKTTKLRAYAHRLVGAQLLAILVLCALVAALFGLDDCLSVFLGGMVCLIPNYFFANRFFVSMRPSEVGRITKAFYLAEIIKLALIALLFVLVVSLVPITMVSFLLGFIVVQLIFWAGPLFLAPGQNDQAGASR